MTSPLRIWSLPWALRYLKHEVLALPGRTAALLFVLFLLLFPLFSQDPYLLRVLTLTALFALYAASWDLLSGYTGQVSLGHAFFFGLAGYASAILGRELGLPPALTIPSGALLATLAGVLVGLPSLRLRGPTSPWSPWPSPSSPRGSSFFSPASLAGSLAFRAFPA